MRCLISTADKSSYWLSTLTHKEKPWKREKGVSPLVSVEMLRLLWCYGGILFHAHWTGRSLCLVGEQEEGKKPTFAESVRELKRPSSAVDPYSFYGYNPSWRVALMEMVDLYGWHSIDGLKLREVQEKLGQFESMTWNEILVGGVRRNHGFVSAGYALRPRSGSRI